MQANSESTKSSQYTLKSSKCNPGIKRKTTLKVISFEIYLEKKEIREINICREIEMSLANNSSEITRPKV